MLKKLAGRESHKKIIFTITRKQVFSGQCLYTWSHYDRSIWKITTTSIIMALAIAIHPFHTFLGANVAGFNYSIDLDMFTILLAYHFCGFLGAATVGMGKSWLVMLFWGGTDTPLNRLFESAGGLLYAFFIGLITFFIYLQQNKKLFANFRSGDNPDNYFLLNRFKIIEKYISYIIVGIVAALPTAFLLSFNAYIWAFPAFGIVGSNSQRFIFAAVYFGFQFTNYFLGAIIGFFMFKPMHWSIYHNL